MNKMGIETFCWFGLWKMHVACCLVLHANAAEQYCNLAAMKITEKQLLFVEIFVLRKHLISNFNLLQCIAIAIASNTG